MKSYISFFFRNRADSLKCFPVFFTFYIALSFFTISSPLHAQTTIDLSKPVGSTKGSAGVSGTGNATYTIPIEVMPGINGVQPSVSLNYNSQGGDINFGQGWSLSCLSAITRAGKSYYYNYNYAPVSYTKANDAYVFDGQRLFVKTGANGDDGSVYGIENENFNKVESFGSNATGPNWFKVTTKNGTVMEYGNATDAKLDTNTNKNCWMVWLLNKVTDINGNYEVFHYSINNTDRNYALTEIDYTGNAAKNIQPNNKIVFTYNVKDKWQTQKTYLAGPAVTTPFLLNTVSVIYDNDNIVKKYTCSYSSLRNQYFLQSLKETGADGSTSLNPLTFTYGSNKVTADLEISPNFPPFNYNNTFTGEMTGDGKQDMIAAYYKIDNNGYPYYTGYNIYSDFIWWGSTTGLSMPFGSGKTFPANARNSIKGNSNYYNFLNNDYDGDGRQDVLMVNWIPSGNNLGFNGVSIDYPRFTSPTSGRYMLSQNYTSIPRPSGDNRDFKYAYKNGTNFIPGDFDGDGAQDYILIVSPTSSTSNNFKAFLSSPKKGIFNREIAGFGVGDYPPENYATTVASAAEGDVTPMDFNGDGKTDIMVRRGTATYILSIYALPAPQLGYGTTQVYSTINSNIQAGYRIFPGDFNGDGNTDLLVRASQKDPNKAWNIIYSTGTSFVSFPFIFSKRPILEGDAGTSISSAHLLMVADLNGDGKSDVWHSLDDLNGDWSSLHFAYYSNGMPMPGQNSTSVFSIESSTSDQSINKSLATATVVGDINGDGKEDIITLTPGGTSSTTRFILPRPLREDRLMTKATDGMGAESSFSYNLTTDNSGVYDRSVNYKYDPANALPDQIPNGNPYTVTIMPMYLVSAINTPNGIGGISTQNYKYTDAVISPLRGFLGYKQTISSNSNTGILNTTYSEIDAALLVPHIVRQTTTYGGNSLSDVTITDALTRVNPTSLTDKRYTYQVTKTRATDGLTGATTQTDLSYDSYNNVTDNVVSKGYLTGSILTTVEKTRTATAYGTHGTPVPASPESVSVFNTRTGQSQVSTQTNYTYDAKGNVLTMKVWDGAPIVATTTNTYDGFGNVATKTVTATGVTTPSLTFTYDNTGRFLTKKEATGSGITKTETFTYDPLWGSLASSKSSDGLTTSYTYDNVFGKLTKTTLPDGNAIRQTFAWESTGNARYSITTQRVADGGKSSKVYYDLLGRNIKTETGGFNNQILTAITAYNYKGQVYTQTDPYYNGETVVTTTTTYDNYGRVTKVSNGTSSLSSAYTPLSNGQFKITTTNAAGQASSKTADAAGRVISSSDNGGQLTFTYDSYGNQLSTQIGSTTVVSGVYDNYGRQTSLTDKNAGTISYEYDALGRIKKQTDALNQAHTMTYDDFGRIISQVGPEGTTSYTYWKDGATGKCNDNIATITGFSGDVTTNTYDAYSRLSSEKKVVDGINFTKALAYDTYGNLVTTTYPSGVVINDTYDKNGALTKTTLGTGASPTLLFEATAINSKGVYTGYKYGNGKTSSVTYDLAKGAPSRYYTLGVQDLNLNFDGQTGNLLQRRDDINNLTEDFTFDNLNRLTGSKVNNVTQFSMTYDASGGSSLGNITSKSDIGNYTYDNNKINAVRFITSAAGGNTPPGVISRSVQDITYTPFLKVSTIQEEDENKQYTYGLTYTYGQDQQRIKSVLTRNGSTIETKYYFGAYERQVYNGVMRDIHYINAGNGLCAIIIKEGSTVTPYFIYTDHLGSILALTGISGTVQWQQNFDAWGRKRNPANWTYTSVPVVPDWLYRGFTEHEHLPQFALINMNGRMYDPVNGRMLSPDNYVQLPFYSQSFNRYSYCANNPLIFTDKSGQVFGLDDLVNGLVGGIINLGSQIFSGNIHGVGQAFGYFGVGFVSGVSVEYGGPMAAGMIAGAGNAWVGGGSLSDVIKGGISGGVGGVFGQAGGQLVGNVIGNGSGIINGALKGIGGGLLGGAAAGTTSGLLNGDNIGQSIKIGANSAIQGAALGAAIGGASGGIEAYQKRLNVWSGKSLSTNNQVIIGPLTGQFEYTRVGRWMSRIELDKMLTDGTVQEGAGGVTGVSVLSEDGGGPTSFFGRATEGSVYVEFDVPTTSLIQGGQTDWFNIVGPSANSGIKYLLNKAGGVMLPKWEAISHVMYTKTGGQMVPRR